MMRARDDRTGFTLIGLLLIAYSQDVAIAQATPRTKAEFLAVYRPAAEKLVRRYRDVRMEVDYSKTKFHSMPDVTARLVIGASGDKVRIEKQYLTGPNAGTRKAAVDDPKGSFSVEAGPERPFHVSGMTSDFEGATESTRLFYPVVSAPYVFREVTVLDWLELDAVEVRSIAEGTVDGERSVTVEYVRGSDLPNMTLHGRFTFLPDRCWAIRSQIALLGTEQDAEADLKMNIEYSGDMDGVPIVKSFETYYEAPGRKVNIERFEVTKFEPKGPPDSDFALPAFGLPDVAEARPGYGRYAIVLVGVAVLILGISLRAWYTRR